MAEHLPQLLGRVRRERREHHDQRVDRLAQHGDRLRPLDPADRRFGAGRRAVRGALAERVELVDELHQRRHRGVQVHPLFDVARSRGGWCRASSAAAPARHPCNRRRTRVCLPRRSSPPSDRRAARRGTGSGSCPRGRRRSTRLLFPAARRTSRTAAARRRRTSAACRPDRRRCPSTSTSRRRP